MNATSKLQRLIAGCKCGVFLAINEHRDYYETAKYRLQHHYRQMECPPEVTPEVLLKMVELDTIVDLQFYPSTPIGSYAILHYDLELVLDAALALLETPT